jgi:formate hydrogenlyase subunit 6/NADH:ubiquinone oxidoreductase subunit I
MRRVIAAIAVSFAVLAMPVVAADAAAKKPVTAKATGTKSMDPVKGRFHRQHTQKLKMGCDTCHTGAPNDILFLRKDDAPAPGFPGQVNREVCASCHTAPAKPAWYGAASR